MLSNMSAQQFDEWRAYDQIEPIGTQAVYLANAITAAAVLNTNRKKGTRPISPSELVPDFLAGAKRLLRQLGIGKIQTAQEQIAIAEALNAAFGGEDLRGKDRG